MKTKIIILLMIIVFFGVHVHANELPLKPEPAHTGHVHSETKEFWIESGAMWGAWTFDTITTHEMFKASPYIIEGGWINKGSRSTWNIMGPWAAVDVGAMGLAYTWKGHVHNRYLHPLWRVPMIVRFEGHFFEGGIHNILLIHKVNGER